MLLTSSYLRTKEKGCLSVCAALVKVNPRSLKAKRSDRVGVASSSSVPAAMASALRHTTFLKLSRVSGIPELLSARCKEPEVLVDERLRPSVNHCGIICNSPGVALRYPLCGHHSLSFPLLWAGGVWGSSLAAPALRGSPGVRSLAGQ